jgi:hypothetical protein
VSILRGYAEENPQVRFTFLDNSTHVGITRNYQRAFAACHSEYVATMEGDDYWISPYKLARQVGFLDAHWECDLCSVNFFVFNEHECRFTLHRQVGSGFSVFGTRDLITDNMVQNFSTCMYRQTALAELPRGVFELQSYDWIINICIGRRGLIGFLHEPMSVYRMHAGGAWSRQSDREKLRSQLSLIPGYDTLTDEVFQAEFRALADRLRQAIEPEQNAQSAAPAESSVTSSTPQSTGQVPPAVARVAKLMLPTAVAGYLLGRGFRGSRG